MSSSVCASCGVDVSAADAWCRRCGAPLRATGDPSIPSYGLPRTSQSTPGYGGSFGPDSGVWRDGKTLIIHKSASLPDYCIKCGAPATGSRLRKRLSWHHPALALLVLLGVLIYVIVALIVRKSAVVDIGLCEDHLSKHRIAVVATWVVFLAGIAFIVLAIVQESGGSALFGILLLFSSAIMAATWAKVIHVKRIDDYYVWLRGIDESFLVMLSPINK